MPPSRLPAEGYIGGGSPGTESERGGARLISRDVVEGFRRERMATAVAELVHEDGVDGLTTARMVARARMSRNTFYTLFADKAEALVYACELARDSLVEPVRAASATPAAWPEPLTQAVAALLKATAEQPLLGELCLNHSATMSPRGSEPAHHAVVEALATAMQPARVAEERARNRRQPPAGLEEFAASAIVSVVAQRVRAGEAARLPALEDDLTSLAIRLCGQEPASARP